MVNVRTMMKMKGLETDEYKKWKDPAKQLPHKCERCGRELFLGDYTYHKGIYYCKEHWYKKRE